MAANLANPFTGQVGDVLGNVPNGDETSTRKTFNSMANLVAACVGNDTLWVFNFGQQPTNMVDEDTEWPDTPLSHFCGADESKCPFNNHAGDPISQV